MQTENVHVETASNSKRNAMSKDPVVLGVTLPLSLTLDAANQVKNAWMQAALEMVNAAKTLANEKKATVAKKADEVVPS